MSRVQDQKNGRKETPRARKKTNKLVLSSGQKRQRLESEIKKEGEKRPKKGNALISKLVLCSRQKTATSCVRDRKRGKRPKKGNILISRPNKERKNKFFLEFKNKRKKKVKLLKISRTFRSKKVFNFFQYSRQRDPKNWSICVLRARIVKSYF